LILYYTKRKCVSNRRYGDLYLLDNKGLHVKGTDGVRFRPDKVAQPVGGVDK
jgi:hypothetical protein